MINYEIASRYAKALVDLATSEKELKKTLSYLQKLVRLLEEIPQLKNFFSAPQIGKEDKVKILKKGLGSGLEPQFLQFLSLLLEKGRFKYLPEITQEYSQMLAKNLGVLEAHIITAVPLDSEVTKKLKAKLEKHYHKNIEISEQIDPQIIGGMTLIVGNQMMDGSIKDRLAKLKGDLLRLPV